MKRCPTCQRTYTDDSPDFCVKDGTRLVAEEASSFDPQKTVMSTAPQPPTPPQQYSNPATPPNYPPPSPQQQPMPQQQAWQSPPPQQQAQNWGGGYYPPQGQAQQWPPQYAQQATGRKSLTLTTLIIGVVSVLALALIFAMAYGVIPPDYDVIQIAYYGSTATGVIAVVLGLLALISKRQRSKWMAVLGLILGIPAILFFIYVQFLRGGV